MVDFNIAFAADNNVWVFVLLVREEVEREDHRAIRRILEWYYAISSTA